uniref:Phospholipid/glycerol acyltransferase domain-containing protein n=1 Tax=Oncorhynchus tshawytscha TaxID=74940 RepID=A0A8C8JJC4_ONCTS
MEDFWAIVLAGLKVWVCLIVALLMVPAMFGFSLGISETYMKILVKILEWATLRIKTVNKAERMIQSSSFNSLVQRDDGSMEEELRGLRRSRPKPPVGGDFTLSDCFYFYRRGIEDIIEDEVTQRFSSEELVSWNLLTRTNIDFQYISLKLTMVWGLGVFIRYCILTPLRIMLASIGLTWLVIGTTAVGFLPNWRLKFWLSEWVHVMCYRICARGLSCTIHYHNKENRPRKGGICVANHTSPIDIVILCNDGCYAMVGQSHGGLMGVLQRAMARSCPHIWFERADMKDRHLVTKRLRDHVNDKTKLPILLFPEGTCINNTSVMMFKKGSFEIGGTIYPVAIKYDPQFGDAFWNSAKYNMVSYLLRMVTSWAIVCNVWYLPAMHQQEGEDAVQFANRVKSVIAHQGGLVDLSWDGGLKRAKVKDTYREEQQKKYSSMVVGSEEGRSDCHRVNEPF